MYVKAVINRLKCGSIKKILPVGEYSKAVNPGSMLEPYVVVFESSKRRTYSANDNGETELIVLAAFPPSYQVDLDKYIYYELMGLLDRKLIRVRNYDIKSTVQVSVTDRISDVITSTSDGYIARERAITIPYRWR